MGVGELTNQTKQHRFTCQGMRSADQPTCEITPEGASTKHVQDLPCNTRISASGFNSSLWLLGYPWYVQILSNWRSAIIVTWKLGARENALLNHLIYFPSSLVREEFLLGLRTYLLPTVGHVCDFVPHLKF